ncbi:MAG TPA: hypothetical protein VEQ42_02185 [Pyrinomonadaceae bacterium]|nr:hypothetical protein [Pyrinomonadaceae bacterium]
MRYWKMRLLGVAAVVVFAGLVYHNWQQLNNEGRYSLRLAAFGPLLIVGGLFMLLLPSKAGKPETGRDKLVVMLVFAAGVLAGLANWYLMDPGFFGK